MSAPKPPPAQRHGSVVSGAPLVATITGCALAGFLVMAGLAWVLRKPVAVPKAAASSVNKARPVPVGVAAAVTGDFGITLAALGTVTPLATVSVKSEVSGKIVQIFYKKARW